MDNQKYFYFDQTLCYGCDACRVACKDWNNVKPGVVSYRKRVTNETGSFPNVSVRHILYGCNHCEKPLCVDICPMGAISKRSKDGAVVVNRDVCIGCKACKGACPYDAPQFEEAEGSKMQKCTMCWDRLDEEGWIESRKIPACVSACPQRAIKFGTLEELTIQNPTLELSAIGFKYDSKAKPCIRFKRK